MLIMYEFAYSIFMIDIKSTFAKFIEIFVSFVAT